MSTQALERDMTQTLGRNHLVQVRNFKAKDQCLSYIPLILSISFLIFMLIIFLIDSEALLLWHVSIQ